MTTKTPFLCQSDDRWANVFIWLSTQHRIKDKGCALTAITEMRTALRAGRAETPLTVMEGALSLWRTRGSKPVDLPAITLPATNPLKLGINIVWKVVADSVGLIIGDRVDQEAGVPAMQDAIRVAIMTGKKALLHVDTNAADADLAGKHYVSAVRFEKQDIICIDPAVGREWSLPFCSLSGTALWSGRTFAVRGVRPVWAKPQ